ncbi:MAG: NAD(P)-dependent oxidoreductase [Candidatus Omnitrophica bacterium]|nr:NAD(P)-dependent oxidoreductase [Candidatus Omnitrophota bacterium]
MRVLLTGASGFIGKHLAAKLLDGNTDLAVYLRQRKRLPHYLLGKVNILEGDLCNWPKTEQLLNNYIQYGRVDCVVHMAASLDFYGKRDQLFKSNTEATVNLFKWSIANEVKKFIFTSTIEAHGPVFNQSLPAAESDENQPVSAYGLSKLEAEKAIIDLGQKAGSPAVIILRLGNVYGPGSNFLIPTIAKSIVKKTELMRSRFLWNDFLYNPVFVSDVADIIYKLVITTACNSGRYNICGKEIVKLEDIYEKTAEGLSMHLPESRKNLVSTNCFLVRRKLLQLLGFCDLPVYFMAGGDQRTNRIFSIEKAEKELEYNPRVTLDEGIKKTLQWCKEEKFLRG